MGSPMAAHVARAGFELTLFDVNPEASNKFVAQHGGKVAASLAELGRNVEAVITMHTFVRLRYMLASNAELRERLSCLWLALCGS